MTAGLSVRSHEPRRSETTERATHDCAQRLEQVDLAWLRSEFSPR